MADTQTFDPKAAGFRVATEPIRRKARTPSSRQQPRPQYADAVWYSFSHGDPLEVEVPVRAVEDTIRKLKAAARYLERTEGKEVRVQAAAEPLLDPATNEPVRPAKSVVKFLGHEPWVLGRRVAKVENEARAAGAQAAEDVIAARPPKHRRTVAGHRQPAHRRASLRGALVGSVITPLRSPSSEVDTGVSAFCGSLPCPPACCSFVLPSTDFGAGVFTMGGSSLISGYYREYVEVTDAPGGPFTATVRLCHDFPEMTPGGGNQVVVFDDRVEMSDDWNESDMPTETWGVLAC